MPFVLLSNTNHKMNIPVCMCANGNTFLMIDCTNHKFNYLKMLFWFVAKKVDSCIVFWVSRSNNKAFIKMDVYFPKGGFCGNGARALSKLLYDKYGNDYTYTIRTPIENVILYKLQSFVLSDDLFGMICNFPIVYNKILFYDSTNNAYSFWNLSIVGENHMITFDDISDESLEEIGMKLSETHITNFSKCYTKSNNLYLKTFERGIKKFTKSCGTATMCASYLAYMKHKIFSVNDGMLKKCVTIGTDGGNICVIINRITETISFMGNVEYCTKY